MSPQLKADLTNSSIFADIGGAMSIPEFCRQYCIGRTKLYAEAKAGRLLLRKIGSKTVIARDDAEAWLHALPAASAS